MAVYHVFTNIHNRIGNASDSPSGWKWASLRKRQKVAPTTDRTSLAPPGPASNSPGSRGDHTHGPFTGPNTHSHQDIGRTTRSSACAVRRNGNTCQRHRLHMYPQRLVRYLHGPPPTNTALTSRNTWHRSTGRGNGHVDRRTTDPPRIRNIHPRISTPHASASGGARTRSAASIAWPSSLRPLHVPPILLPLDGHHGERRASET